MGLLEVSLVKNLLAGFTGGENSGTFSGFAKIREIEVKENEPFQKAYSQTRDDHRQFGETGQEVGQSHPSTP